MGMFSTWNTGKNPKKTQKSYTAVSSGMSFAKDCDVLGCGERKPCPHHGRKRAPMAEQPDYRRLYKTKRWEHTTQVNLRRYPRCGDRPPGAPMTDDSQCRAQGKVVAAKVTDHIIPHRGDLKLFWSPTNRQSLCWSCSGVKSQRERAA